MKLSLPTYARRVMSAHGCLLALMLLVGVGTPLSAQPDYNLSAMRQEKFDRGLVAVSTTSGNFLSWRYLPGDPEGYADRATAAHNGETYRRTRRLATIALRKCSEATMAKFRRVLKHTGEIASEI